MKKVQIELSWNLLWQIMIFLGIIILFYVSRQAIGVLFASIILSLGLDPIVSFFERRGINRLIGTIIVFLLAMLIFAIAMYFIVPIFIVEASSFVTQFNDVISAMLGFGIPESVIEAFSANLNKILSFITSTNGTLGNAIGSVITNIVLAITTIIITFYLSVEKNGTERLLEIILPRIYEKPVLKVFSKFKEKIRVWLVAQLGLSLIVGTVVSVGLWLLGVEYALVLGIIAAVLELVPVVGPILSGFIAFLIAIANSFALGIYVLIFFFVVQQLENNVLIPMIMRKAMRIHPVMVLVALLAGGQAAGLVGILLAVPVALMAQEIFNYLAHQKEQALAEENKAIA
ncbi:MAG: AI-2E family transporter [Candidatus Paceibacterota bacterium]